MPNPYDLFNPTYTPADPRLLASADGANVDLTAFLQYLQSLGLGGGGGAVASVAGKTGAVSLVKGDVGLGNVDNTADTAKPVSTAQQTAITAAHDQAVTDATTAGATVFAPLVDLLTTVNTAAASTTSLTAKKVQPVDTTTGSATLAPLPSLSSLALHTRYGVQKTDGSLNTLTVPFASGDTTLTGSASAVLRGPGTLELEVVANPTGVGKLWRSAGHARADDAGDARNATLFGSATTVAANTAAIASSNPALVGVQDQLATALALHARYAYATWYVGQGYPAAPGYINFPSATETTIRYAGSWAVGMAAAAATGVFSRRAPLNNGTSVQPVSQLIAAAAQLAASLARQHATNRGSTGATGPSWGLNDPQSGYWAASCGFVWQLIPNVFTPTEVGWIKAMTAAEADYTVSLRSAGQVWRTVANGASASPVVAGSGSGNGRSEESSWNVQTCAMALALNPEHANAQAWADCMIVNALHGFARFEDLSDASVVNGKTLSSVLTGFNLMSNGFIPNHGVAHPDYVGAAINQFYFSMLALALSGKPAPRAMRRNMERPYVAFNEFAWLKSAGFQDPVTVTMLGTPRSTWPTTSQSSLPRDLFGNLVADVYYPESDPGRTPGAPYMTTKAFMALAADHLGMDATTRAKAVDVAALYLRWTLDRQARTLPTSNNYGAVSLPSGASGYDTEDAQGEPEPNLARSLGLAMRALQLRGTASQLGTLVDDTSAQLASRYLAIGGGAPTPPPDTTPPTVQTFTASPGNTQNVLNWAGIDNVGITRWVLKTGSTVLYDGANTTFTHTGLTNGTSVSYSLQAYDAAGNVSTAATASATPSNNDTTAPVVSAFTVTPGNTQNVLNWAATDNVAVTGYTVTRAGTTIYTGTASTFTDTGLTNGTAYSYTLTAADAAGNTATASASGTPALTPTIRDTFTGPSGQALTGHSADIGGGPWVKNTTTTGTISLTANGEAQATSTAGSFYVLPTITPALANKTQWTIPVKSLLNVTRLWTAVASTSVATGMRLSIDASDGATIKFTLVRANAGTNTTIGTANVTMTSPPAAGGTLYVLMQTDSAGKVKIFASSVGMPDGTGTPLIDGTSDASPITTAGFLGLGFTATTFSDTTGLPPTLVEVY